MRIFVRNFVIILSELSRVPIPQKWTMSSGWGLPRGRYTRRAWVAARAESRATPRDAHTPLQEGEIVSHHVQPPHVDCMQWMQSEIKLRVNQRMNQGVCNFILSQECVIAVGQIAERDGWTLIGTHRKTHKWFINHYG